jgi:hypothetical protein
MARVEKKINILTSPTSSESLGTSSSSNVTAESSGYVGDGSSSLFPQLKKDKSWCSKTDTNIEHTPEIRQGNEK